MFQWRRRTWGESGDTPAQQNSAEWLKDADVLQLHNTACQTGRLPADHKLAHSGDGTVFDTVGPKISFLPATTYVALHVFPEGGTA